MLINLVGVLLKQVVDNINFPLSLKKLCGRAKNGLENIVELGVLRCCSRCKKTKLVDDFSANKRSPDGKRSWCKECFNKQTKSYNRTYLEKNYSYELNRYRTYHEKHKTEINERARNRNRINPFPRRESSARRRAQKSNSVVNNTITIDEWKRLLTLHGNRCAYCDIVFEDLTIDHITPLSRGGSHDISNINPACSVCNISKGNRLLSELNINGSLLIEQRMAAAAANQR